MRGPRGSIRIRSMQKVWNLVDYVCVGADSHEPGDSEVYLSPRIDRVMDKDGGAA